MRAAGAQPRACRRWFTTARNAELSFEVRRAGERAVGQERAFEIVVCPLDHALRTIGRLAHDDLRGQPAAECLAIRRELRLARLPPADRRPRPGNGTATSRSTSCHSPANSFSALRDSISLADSHREYP
jgi:hypothetical protein